MFFSRWMAKRDGFVPLVVDEHFDVVALRKPFNRPFSVFEYASNEIVGDADVQRSTGFVSQGCTAKRSFVMMDCRVKPGQ